MFGSAELERWKSVNANRNWFQVSYNIGSIFPSFIICTYWLSGRDGRENICPEINGHGARTERTLARSRILKRLHLMGSCPFSWWQSSVFRCSRGSLESRSRQTANVRLKLKFIIIIVIVITIIRSSSSFRVFCIFIIIVITITICGLQPITRGTDNNHQELIKGASISTNSFSQPFPE